jgi:hypothetical protein
VKCEKLLGRAEFERRDRERVKRKEGSMIETNGSLETEILDGENGIAYRMQPVSKQVDLKCDGILCRNFLKAMQSRIYYRKQVLIFQQKGIFIRKKLMSIFLTEPAATTSEQTLPARTEQIVQLPGGAEQGVREGLVERAELVQGYTWRRVWLR